MVLATVLAVLLSMAFSGLSYMIEVRALAGKLNSLASAQVFPWCGSGIDSAFGVAADSMGAYVMGVTDSTNFQTVNPFQPANGGGTADLFIARIKAAPRIDAALVDWKKLIVTGSGFDHGAKILIDGQEQKTANDSQNPAGSCWQRSRARRSSEVRPSPCK